MTNKGKQLNNMLYKVTETHKQCLQELEQYAYYITRCLQEHFEIRKVVLLTHPFENNGITQAVAYPIEEMKKETPNPIFFLGYTLKIEKDGIHIAFADNYKDYKKMREKL